MNYSQEVFETAKALLPGLLASGHFTYSADPGVFGSSPGILYNGGSVAAIDAAAEIAIELLKEQENLAAYFE